MDLPRTDSEREELHGPALDDVDTLIRQLETQFEDSRLMPTAKGQASASCYCTNAKGCTGTCPCAQ
ncbi:hypothetical protein [Kitasatospora aureofaciens]|uniref:hypothetical protein n=1 Tax=Kitasatospora aureofaciens TaxID=1894 RepID=UPI0036F499E3